MSLPTSHLAAILPAPRQKLEIKTRATPSISLDEVLIKITATAINPIDWKFQDDFPDVLNYLHIIAQIGSDVTNFKIGDLVFFQGIINKIEFSTFQQYCQIPAALVGKTPDNLTDEQVAGGLGIQPPWSRGGEGAGKGKALLVIGGSSSVGQYAVQMARISGFERVVTNSSPAHFDALKGLGATHILDRSTATPEEYVKAVGGLEAILVLDAILIHSTRILEIDILQLLKGGDVVTLLPIYEEAIKVPNPDPEREVRTKRITGLGSLPGLRHLSEPLVKVMGGEDGWLAKGLLQPNKVEVVDGGLGGLERALERNKKGLSGVKVVIRPQD
ncbi:related to NADPH:quinone reductase and related Zn-dependent oxidoreductases [Phialocephala subalpina]|uniref:Related to NADPH:quinone reductase and related Zn-dependent oxidoreductases n=1 Tax=Phialocephala subalpina TaxID=576137 RepID=A0A1L7WME3_9HELO|nr:related to NADPH:quinone reductase and related Zn-dependent oxidoreductases [Phialocephala subalpina]